MNVLVTGGTGFLGVHLVRELLEAGQPARITVVSRVQPKQALRRLGDFLAGAGATGLADGLATRVTAVRGDLTRPRMGLAPATYAELTDRCDAVWHCAADTRLGQELTTLWQTNVAGTTAVLEFLAACPRRPRLYHVGTAFVAGARRTGTIHPEELDDAFGFENPYEQTKFAAERAVRAWAARHDRPAVVFRPSILATNQSTRPGMPVMGYFGTAGMAKAPGTIFLARHTRLPAALDVRLVGDPLGHLNILPVEVAAARMVRLSRFEPAGPVDVHHVVHEHEVPVLDLVELVRLALAPMTDARITLVPRPVPDPTPWERLTVRFGPALLGYLRHRRHYDDTSVQALLGERRSGIRVDRDYLAAAAAAGLAAAGAPTSIRSRVAEVGAGGRHVSA